MKRQQQANEWNARRQQQINQWNVQRQQAEINARRQQQINAWNARRQQQANAWNVKRQQQIADWNQRRQQQQWNERSVRRQRQNVSNGWPRQSWNNGRGRSEERPGRGFARRQQQQTYYSPQIFSGTVFNNGRGWGGARRDEPRYRQDMKWAWKSEKRAQTQFAKEQRRNARWAGNNYYFDGGSNYYFDRGSDYGTRYSYRDYDDYNYDRGSEWRQNLIRVIVDNGGGSYFGDRDFGGYYGYEPENYYYSRPRYTSYARYDYEPAYYNSPLFAGYGDDYGFDTGYASFGESGGFGGLLDQLPIGDIIGQFLGGDDFVSGLLGSFLSQGYDEGFLAGQFAKENGWGDRYFDDPYDYEGEYLPYSYSVAQNRQVLSEGYCLGFEDALRGRDDYDPFDQGNVDLVSALLGNVLGNS